MFTTSLRCGHKIRWPSQDIAPSVGEHVWCARCQDMQTVAVIIGPWRLRCLTCRDVYMHSTDREAIDAYATSHVAERLHTVAVWCFGTDQHWYLRPDDNASSVRSSGTVPHQR